MTLVKGITVSKDFIDLWIGIQDWSVKPLCRLKAASEHIWLKSHKKLKFELQSWMNVERLLVYIDPAVRYVTFCILSYGHGTT